MQNQRTTVVGQLMYKNSLDCVQKVSALHCSFHHLYGLKLSIAFVRQVFRNEGLRGFYRGLVPQLLVRHFIIRRTRHLAVPRRRSLSG